MKALNIKDMVLKKGKCTFFIKRPLKTTKPDFHQSPVAFSEYPSNSKICIVTTITHYLEITKDLRITAQPIISYKKPHKAVTTMCKIILAGGAKSYLEKQELILKSIRHTQQDQPPQLRQKLRDYRSVK